MRAKKQIGVGLSILAILCCLTAAVRCTYGQDVKPDAPASTGKPDTEIKNDANSAPKSDVKPADQSPAIKKEPEVKSTPAPVETSLKIGVVNLVDVFSKYNKTKDYEKLLEREKIKQELAIKELENQIKKLNDELDQLSKSSELYMEKNEQLTSLMATRRYKVENWNNYIKSRVNEQTLKIYKDIREAIDIFGKENNYTYIFKSDPSLATAQDSDDITQQISVRTVLYYPKSADITEDIVKILNKEK